jgi:hypothetical protein
LRKRRVMSWREAATCRKKVDEKTKDPGNEGRTHPEVLLLETKSLALVKVLIGIKYLGFQRRAWC